jgi:MFS family permease
VASFAKLFSGYVTDRVSHRKPIVVGGYFVANAVKPLLALVSSWWQILGIRFSDRFAKGVRGTARDVMVAESVDKSSLGSAYGLIQAMDSAGAIAGPLLALAVIGRLGCAASSPPPRFPGALCVIVAWIGIREVRRNPPVQGRAPSPLASRAQLWDGRGRPSPTRSEWLPKLPLPFYYVLAVVTLFSLGNSSDMFLVLRAGNIGIPASRAPLLGLVFNIMFTLLSWPAGKFSDRFSRSAIAAAGYFVFAIVYFVFALAPSQLAIWLAMAFYGLFYALTNAVLKALVVESVAVDVRGRAPGNFFVSHQRHHAALERDHRSALEGLWPSRPVLFFGRDRNRLGVRAARPPFACPRLTRVVDGALPRPGRVIKHGATVAQR